MRSGPALVLLFLLTVTPRVYAWATCPGAIVDDVWTHTCDTQPLALADCHSEGTDLLPTWAGYTGYQCLLAGAEYRLMLSATDGAWSDTWLQARFRWGTVVQAPDVTPWVTRSTYSFTHSPGFGFADVNLPNFSPSHSKPFHHLTWSWHNAFPIRFVTAAYTSQLGYYETPEQVIYPAWWNAGALPQATAELSTPFHHATDSSDCPQQGVLVFDPANPQVQPSVSLPAKPSMAKRWVRRIVASSSPDQAHMKACHDVVWHSVMSNRQTRCLFFTGFSQEYLANIDVRTAQDYWGMYGVRSLCGASPVPHTEFHLVIPRKNIEIPPPNRVVSQGVADACPDAGPDDPCVAVYGIRHPVGYSYLPALASPLNIPSSPPFNASQPHLTVTAVWWASMEEGASLTACDQRPQCPEGDADCQARISQWATRCALLGFDQSVSASCGSPVQCHASPSQCAAVWVDQALQCAAPADWSVVQTRSALLSSHIGAAQFARMRDALFCDAADPESWCTSAESRSQAWARLSADLRSQVQHVRSSLVELDVAEQLRSEDLRQDIANALDVSALPLPDEIIGSGWLDPIVFVADKTGFFTSRACPLHPGPLVNQQTLDAFCPLGEKIAGLNVLFFGFLAVSLAWGRKHGPSA